MQFPKQHVSLGLQITGPVSVMQHSNFVQTPSQHLGLLGGQAFPQAPQCWGLELTSVHAPPSQQYWPNGQHVSPQHPLFRGQQLPPQQTFGEGQKFPQNPQFSGSLPASTHSSRQQNRPGGQTRPHAPQLLSLPIVSVGFPLQHASPVGTRLLQPPQ